MATRIYTKTGDEGKTSLIGGTRVSKGSLRIEAYGTVDELNAFIGWTRDLIGDQDTGIFLTRIQDRLFTIGSALAADPSRELKMRLPDLRDVQPSVSAPSGPRRRNPGRDADDRA